MGAAAHGEQNPVDERPSRGGLDRLHFQRKLQLPRPAGARRVTVGRGGGALGARRAGDTEPSSSKPSGPSIPPSPCPPPGLRPARGGAGRRELTSFSGGFQKKVRV
jgi:hypothetical protein